MRLFENTSGSLSPTRLVRVALLLLLLICALGSAVAYAQDGGQAADADPPPLTVEEPPPQPDPPPQSGEVRHIAEVTVESAEDVDKLQQLGCSCALGKVCHIEVTEAQLTAIQDAGLEVKTVGLVATAWVDPAGLEQAYVSGQNTTNYTVRDCCPATSFIRIAGAPAGALTVRIKYSCRIDQWIIDPITGGPGDYMVSLGNSYRTQHGYPEAVIWLQHGDRTDRGYDDDAMDDRDIYLYQRSSDSRGEPVNQDWYLKVDDRIDNLSLGYIDWWQLWVYYCTVPSAPTLIAPGHGSHTCLASPTLDWSSVSGAIDYWIQVDDHSDFSSPTVNGTYHRSSYTPPALARRRWYWRVKAKNDCGWGSWSSTRYFDIDPMPSAPSLVRPHNGTHTCDVTDPDFGFGWSSVTGANMYSIRVDNDAGFPSPEIARATTSPSFKPTTRLAPDTYHWQVRAWNNCGVGPWSTQVWSFTVDPAPGTVGSPLPANGATGVSINANLDWASASNAASYDVHFGTSATPPLAGSVTVSAYDLPTLSPSTTYYWQIKARNHCGYNRGPIWRFTTAGTANQPPVNGTLAPNSGGAPAGQMVYLTSTYSDPNGQADLKACRLHVGRDAAPKSLMGNAVLLYQARTNKLLIRNDRGTRWWGGRLVGSANVVQNSQVRAYCDRTTVTRGGNTIIVRWALEFKPAFRGGTKMYLKARDVGGLTSPLERKGTWTVQ